MSKTTVTLPQLTISDGETEVMVPEGSELTLRQDHLCGPRGEHPIVTQADATIDAEDVYVSDPDLHNAYALLRAGFSPALSELEDEI